MKNQITHEMFMVLLQTAHGHRYYRETSDPESVKEDLGLYESLPRSVHGPYLVGPEGYKSVEEAFQNDPDTPDLDNPQTWFEEEF